MKTGILFFLFTVFAQILFCEKTVKISLGNSYSSKIKGGGRNTDHRGFNLSKYNNICGYR